MSTQPEAAPVPSSHALPVARLGVVGGGQLARMMVPAAARLGCETTVLDPTAASPGGELATHEMVGAFDDAAALRALVEASTVTTYEIETIDTEVLRTLAAEGHHIVPDPAVLAVIQDKLLQKRALADAGIPTSEFDAVDAPDARRLADFGLPLVQKARRGGYDGRGVAVFRDVVIEEQVLPVPSLVERYVDYRCELAVLVGRGADGATRSWPVVEMVFDDRANVLDVLVAPARIDAALAERAREIAVAAVEALDGVGVFGVELFLTRRDEILVNEIAPRTHNSGHWTIEACATSQFEQHVRAVTGLPLGDTHQHSPAVMVNLLGAEDAHGTPMVDGLDEVLALPGVAVHLYGKRTVRPWRKMGHVTVTAADVDAALDIARRVRETLVIRGTETA
jgi:5-(carboxyamino)imidazole ribonucleotide synthase